MPPFANDTVNQHYLPRVEQELNASNPQSTSGKFRIYSFRVTNRERYEIALESEKGRSVSSNLSMLDLFSFDVPGGSALRQNLEEHFHKYERVVKVHTLGLLEKFQRRDNDVKTELIDVFAAKFLNFVRNPFCIQKVLNSFPKLTSYDPADPALFAVYRQIITGRRPHQAHLCRQLGISDAVYTEWLRLLFMLLVPLRDGQPNVFESVIKGLFESRETQAAVFVSMYDGERCLLSDRGYCQPLPDGDGMSMSFNLSSTAFADFVFRDPSGALAGKASPEFVAMALENWRHRPQVTVNITAIRNNLNMLARYNRRVIEQCHERVYCSVSDGIRLHEPV